MKMRQLSAVFLSFTCAVGLSLSCSSDKEAGGSGSVNAGGSAAGGSTGSGAGVGVGASVGTGGALVTQDAGGPTGSADAGLDDLRDAACAGWRAEPEGLPAILQLVVDVSGSMDDEAPGASGQSKWEVTRDALAEAIDAMPEALALGILYYPNRDTDETNQDPQAVDQCVATDELLPIDTLGPPDSAHRQAVGASLSAAQPDGLTPTHDAYAYALENGLLASDRPGQRFMLLITDGAPTLAEQCVRTGRRGSAVSPDPIVDAIAAAAAQGVQTFVIGSPGSEVGDDDEDMRPWLSRAALAGGTARPGCAEEGPNFCHFDMTQEADFAVSLAAVLSQISGSIISCEYQLPAPDNGQTLDLQRINAVLTPVGGQPEFIGQALSADCTEGWIVEGDTLRLCPQTCDRVQADGTASFELIFGCEPVAPPIE
ncbi:MAG TPA: hypothetical protein VKZ49_07700 [Polyangiaceae bacterium]|nr:hypothetical protein [Polyangiaceae bacterium]